MRRHRVEVRIGTTVVGLWTRYTIDVDMLAPADQFSMTLAPGSREVFDLCRVDAPCQVVVDGTTILSGRIKRRNGRVSVDGSSVDIMGYDTMEALVGESMPLLERLPSLNLEQLLDKVAGPYFDRVTFSNARNRALVRGRGARLARGSAEPVFTSKRYAPKKVDPGDTRFSLALRYLREAKLLAWSSGDGTELFVGLPNDSQRPQYRFFVPARNSRRRNEGNVLDLDVEDDISDRYSEIRVVGSGRANSETYGRAITQFEATATDDSGDFLQPRRLILTHPKLTSKAEARELAEWEMAIRRGIGHIVRVVVPGHAQALYDDAPPALYAIDNVADVEVEEWGIHRRYLVTGLTFLDTARDGETTEVRMVPVGTTLAQ